MSGIEVVHPSHRSPATAQTTGMRRQAAVSPETTGNKNLWVGVTITPPHTQSGWHHHGDCETAIYVVRGRARFEWGQSGDEFAQVGAGDFLAVAPNAIHREITLDDEVELVVARACSGILVVNVAGPEMSS